MPKRSKDARIARLERRLDEAQQEVAELKRLLTEWRPLAAYTVPSEPVDAQALMRAAAGDFRAYDESTGWAFHPAGYL